MDADSLRTIPALIDAFGGATAFSKVIGKGPSTASEMKRSGRIDVRYWPAILDAAPAAGIAGLQYAHLVHMHVEAPPPEPAQVAGARQ